MRPFFLVFLVISAVIGIPRLAYEIRNWNTEDKALAGAAIFIAPENQPSLSPVAPIQRTMQRDTPPAVEHRPDSLQPSQFVAVPISEASATPARAPEVISAIQKELSRLGYYDGPVTDRWSKAARHAARAFKRQTGHGVRHTHPSIELLMSLQTAQPLKKQETNPDAVRDLQPPVAAQASPAIDPPKEAHVVEAAARNDDYLPPWMTTGKGRSADAGTMPPSRDGRQTELAEAPGRAEPRKITHHRLHRTARAWRERHAYQSYRSHAVRWARSGFFFAF